MSSQAAEEPGASLQLAARSDVGRVREANEDSCDIFLRDDGARLLVVADGMGGHRGGATASATAVATIGEIFRAGEATAQEAPGDSAGVLERAIEAANERIHALSRHDRALAGMGTTVVALLVDGRLRGSVAHVGDSRCYRLRRGQIEALTVDHSVVAEMQRRGLISAEEAAVHPRRNEILRSVGVLPEVDVEIAEVDIAPGDRFVLCSDGLSGVVGDDEIATIVGSESPEEAVDSLIRLANDRGGPDNISVQVLALPAAADDPDATAPVSLSASALAAIRSRRRLRDRRLWIAVAVLLIVAGALLHLLWPTLFPADEAGSGPAPRPTPVAIDPAQAPAPDPLLPPAGLEHLEAGGEPPRRGIQR